MTDRTCRRATALLITASTLALASPAGAVDVLFSTHDRAGAQVGQRVSQADGLTQFRLDNGAVVSFVDGADYRLNADGTVDLYRGSVTVAGGPQGVTVVRMPDGVEGRVGGQGSAANFSVAGDGSSHGHAMSGSVQVVRSGNLRTFAAGEMWQSAGQGGLRRVVSNGVQDAPGNGPVVPMADGGPVAAAENGIPVSLGDALAAAGASGDVIAAARRVEAAAGNPSLDTFPSGDFALLVAYAARFENLNGGTPFPSASADIIRTYLGFLAGGGARANFLSAYAGFMVQYLDLVRAGALPSSFSATSLADINAFIAYTGRTSGFASLSSANRALVEAYLAFLQGGGNPDLFASRYTDLVNAYFSYLRGGGDPAAFTGATQTTVGAYLAFLNDSGLLVQLSAQNRALLQAYLANGGFAFTGQYKTALDAYFAYLSTGRLPSEYDAIPPATLRQYLETLQATGLFDQVLGAQAQFFAGYLAYLQQGGSVDGYPGLNANVFAGYATQLADFYAYLQGGGLPNGYSGNVQQLFAYLAALQQAGALDAFLGNSSTFFGEYLAFVQGGGDVSLFAKLPGLNLDTFADALNAYALYLSGKGLPSGYTAEELAKLADYFEIIRNSGRIDSLLGGNASLISAYFTYLAGGGSPDNFSGLPVYADYVTALNAYYAFLAGGGLPADYTGLTQSQIRAYLDALQAAGGLGAYASLQGFFSGYYTYLVGGGSASGYSGLPVYGDYVAALNAYYTYLAGGGLPGDYTALTPAQIQAYLAALQAAGGLGAYTSLQAFFADYYAFITGGGKPNEYASLPLYQSYLAALQAYYDYLLAGGLPSAYTALTQAQIKAYLALLDQYGVLQAALSGSYLTFLVDYLAYVGGGGDPDMFAGLPTSGGGTGGGGGTPGAPTPLSGYSGGFNAATANVNMIVAGGLGGPGAFAGGESGFQTSAYTLNGSGGLTSYNRGGSVTRTSGSTTVGDIYGTGDVVIGRWYSGTNTGANTFTMSANQGLHYMLARPLEVALPASGRIDYYLVAATPATIADGSYAPGTFEAEMAILFGSQNKLAMEGTITMPTGGSDYVYSFSTTGGMANADQTTNVITPSANGHFNTYIRNATDNAGRCPSADSCLLGVFGSFAKDQNTIGMTYEAYTGASGKDIVGAAIFQSGPARGTPAPTPSPTPTPTPTPTPSGFTGTRTSQVYYTFTSGSLASAFGGSTDFVDGAPVKFTSALGTVDKNTAEAVESGDLGIVAWARWTNGTVATRSILGNADTVIGANGGYHVMSGYASTVIPSSGKVDYSLRATTSATDSRGSTPGTVTGDLSILFGTVSRVGYSMQMDVGGWGWGVTTTGGAADPSQSPITLTLGSAGPTFGGTFTSTGGTVTGTGGACSASCIVNVSGALYGDNGAFAGVAMDVIDASVSGTVTADGLLIFGNTPATTTALATTAVPAADVNMASGQGDWARWSGSASTSAVSTLSAPALQREAAAGLAGIDIAGIEERLGKFITFDRP